MGEFYRSGPEALGWDAFEKCQLVYLEWLDSHNTASWYSNVERSHEPLDMEPCRSVGWVMRESEQVIEIVQSLAVGEGNSPQSCGTLTIPKAAIIKRKKLCVPA